MLFYRNTYPMFLLLKETNFMAESKNTHDGHDSSKVNGNQSYELSYLEEKYGVTRDQVKQAIAAVGNNREDVEKHLMNEGSGGNALT
jgi:hypothetical protein